MGSWELSAKPNKCNQRPIRIDLKTCTCWRGMAAAGHGLVHDAKMAARESSATPRQFGLAAQQWLDKAVQRKAAKTRRTRGRAEIKRQI